ncbi:MAG: hypothetical protein ACE5GB_06355, partial [Acidimicrobiales bacterium]
GLDDLLDHRIGLLAALIFALASFAAAELVRGVLSGRHRFACYGRYFAVEGGSRLVFAVVLAVVGVRSVGAYAVTLAGAFALAAFVSLGSERPFVRPGPEAGYRELTPALGLLLVASLGEAFTLNVGPVALDLIAPEGIGEDAPGVLLDGLIISRIPLFFFQAVKASLLPSLAALAGSDELHRFRDVQLRIVAAVLGLAASAVAVSAAVGPWLVETLFGDQLGSRDMALLAASGGGLMVQLSLGLGLVALGHTRLAVVGWVVAVASFPFVIQLADEPFLRVELAMVASVVLGSLVTGGLLGLRYEAHVAEGRVAPATSADPGDRHGATADSGPVDGGSAGA